MSISFEWHPTPAMKSMKKIEKTRKNPSIFLVFHFKDTLETIDEQENIQQTKQKKSDDVSSLAPAFIGLKENGA